MCTASQVMERRLTEAPKDEGTGKKLLTTEMSPETMEDMMKYVYYGEKANPDRAEKLLEVAYDFNLTKLNKVLEIQLCPTVNYDNVHDRLILAYKSGSATLRGAILNHIMATGCALDFIQGPKWANLMRDYTQLGMETCTALYKHARYTQLTYEEATGNGGH